MQDEEKDFRDRVAAQIELANSQVTEEATFEHVSASNMFATARYNAWASACGWNDGVEMKAARQETVEYFVAEYRKVLEENMDDYIENFDAYMKVEE